MRKRSRLRGFGGSRNLLPLYKGGSNVPLAVLARDAVSEDQTRLAQTTQLAGQALPAVAQAQDAVQWVNSPREEVDADMVHRRIFRKVHCHDIMRQSQLYGL
jgi:hypothetical protein